MSAQLVLGFGFFFAAMVGPTTLGHLLLNHLPPVEPVDYVASWFFGTTVLVLAALSLWASLALGFAVLQ